MPGGPHPQILNAGSGMQPEFGDVLSSPSDSNVQPEWRFSDAGEPHPKCPPHTLPAWPTPEENRLQQLQSMKGLPDGEWNSTRPQLAEAGSQDIMISWPRIQSTSGRESFHAILSPDEQIHTCLLL